MTRFYISPLNINTWLKQNKAETLEFREGCLQDNFIVGTKRGYAAIYEHYVNPWVSDLIVEFEAGDAPNVWKRWEEFTEAYDKEYPEAG